MPYGLKQETINKLKELFLGISEIDEVIIYGSRAKSNYKDSSDIDITLKGANLSLMDINRLSNRIDDLLLPYTFDISIYHHLKNKNLIEHIDRVGKVFYKRD